MLVLYSGTTPLTLKPIGRLPPGHARAMTHYPLLVVCFKMDLVFDDLDYYLRTGSTLDMPPSIVSGINSFKNKTSHIKEGHLAGGKDSCCKYGGTSYHMISLHRCPVYAQS